MTNVYSTRIRPRRWIAWIAALSAAALVPCFALAQEAPIGPQQLPEYNRPAPRAPSLDDDIEESWIRRTLYRITHPFAKEGDDKPRERMVRQPDGTWRIDNATNERSTSLQRQFAEAEGYFREKEYNKAAWAFSGLARRYKDTAVEEEALFYRAESLFLMDQYPKAQDIYAKLLTKYPTTRFLPEAVQRTYDIAFYWLEDSRRRAQGQPGTFTAASRYVNFFDRTRPILDTEGRAVNAIETIQQFDPFGPLTDDAVMMAGAHTFFSGDFVKAASYYEQIVEDQPRSEHASKALVLGAQAYLRSYNGPDYDGDHLEKAERLTKAALARSNSLPSEQVQRLEQDLRVIHLERAKREYRMAQKYAQIQKPTAARYHYGLVIENFSDTPYAKLADEAVRGIDDRSLNPEDSDWSSLASRWRFWRGDKDTEIQAVADHSLEPDKSPSDAKRPGLLNSNPAFRRFLGEKKSQDDPDAPISIGEEGNQP